MGDGKVRNARAAGAAEGRGTHQMGENGGRRGEALAAEVGAVPAAQGGAAEAVSDSARGSTWLAAAATA